MRIFISNIDYQATEQDLLRILRESSSEPKSVKIIRDRDTGRSRGFAFAELNDEAAAERAIVALDGVYVNARRLNATKAREDVSPRKASMAGAGN